MGKSATELIKNCTKSNVIVFIINSIKILFVNILCIYMKLNLYSIMDCIMYKMLLQFIVKLIRCMLCPITFLFYLLLKTSTGRIYVI